MRRKPTTNLAGLLRINYPSVYRIAVALSGNDKVVRRVLQRAGPIYRTWESDEDAARWFARFTVLCCRDYGTPDPKRDLLLRATTDPEITAMIYAVRQLPMQQREAFLLHHGQGMELRQMATAMDCSSAAAATHLTAAAKGLRVLSPGELAVFTSALPGLLELLVPPPRQVEMQVRRVIRRRRLSALVKYGVVWPVGLGLLGVMGWEGMRVWRMIEI